MMAVLSIDDLRAARGQWKVVTPYLPIARTVVRIRNGSETKPGRYFRRDDGQFHSLDEEGRVEAQATHWQAA